MGSAKGRQQVNIIMRAFFTLLTLGSCIINLYLVYY